MRKAIQEHELLRKEVEYDVKNLMQTFKNELVPMAKTCWSKLDRKSACIVWVDDDNIKNHDAVRDEGIVIYGESAGMYLCEGNGEDEVYITLPKSTKAYIDFYTAICDLHCLDSSLYEETIPDFVDINYRGNNYIEMVFACNLAELPEDAYESAKTIANELIEMLSGIEGFESVEYFEGDENGCIVLERKNINYFVGCELCFRINED